MTNALTAIFALPKSCLSSNIRKHLSIANRYIASKREASSNSLGPKNRPIPKKTGAPSTPSFWIPRAPFVCDLRHSTQDLFGRNRSIGALKRVSFGDDLRGTPLLPLVNGMKSMSHPTRRLLCHHQHLPYRQGIGRQRHHR